MSGLSLASCAAWPDRLSRFGVLQGRVVDLQGQPLPGVELTVGHRTTRSGPDGGFRLLVPRQPTWLTARGPGLLPTLRAVLPGHGTLVRLSRDDARTLVIRAGGDVMAGRRFYTPEPGSRQRPLLKLGDQVEDHRRLLEPIAPLLAQAHLSLLNLESPLLADPVAERNGLRSERFHPSKDFVFASGPGLAAALRQAGVDVLGLANNHVYDALEPGLRSTLSVLEDAGYAAGVGYFGAGETPQLAWRPALQRVRGEWISSLGCTTIHGAQHPWSYVASLDHGKGGAALCEPVRLAEAIRVARRRGPVIVMVHGGNEYQAAPTPPVSELVQVALRSGATLILNHHPHVTGGLRWDGRSLVADSLGNLLFDQTIWPTFPSLLLEVQLHQGRIRRVSGYPLLLHGYRPHVAVGALADWILAGVASLQPGPWLLESGVLEADLGGEAVHQRRWIELAQREPPSGLWQLAPGERVCGTRRFARVELGRDLIGVGRFEDELLGAAPAAGALWLLGHQDLRVDPAAAHQGRYGVRLERRALNLQPLLLRPLHRLPVRPGQRLSLLAWIRGSAAITPLVQISWYGSRRGPSQARLVQPVRLRQSLRWQAVRVDAVVPLHTVAAGVAIALEPPQLGRVHLDVDDLALVHWQDPVAGQHQGTGWLRAQGAGSMCLSSAVMPGASHSGATTALKAWP